MKLIQAIWPLSPLNMILAQFLIVLWSSAGVFYLYSKIPTIGSYDGYDVIKDCSYCTIDSGCHDVVIAGCTNVEVKTSNVLVDNFNGKIMVSYMSHEHALSIIKDFDK